MLSDQVLWPLPSWVLSCLVRGQNMRTSLKRSANCTPSGVRCQALCAPGCTWWCCGPQRWPSSSSPSRSTCSSPSRSRSSAKSTRITAQWCSSWSPWWRWVQIPTTFCAHEWPWIVPNWCFRSDDLHKHRQREAVRQGAKCVHGVQTDRLFGCHWRRNVCAAHGWELVTSRLHNHFYETLCEIFDLRNSRSNSV